MRRPTIATLLLATLAFMLAGSAWSQQWKWRDSSGRITVSDLPPPRDVADKDILQRPEPGPRKAAAKPGATAASGPTAASAPAATASVPRAGDKELEARKKAADAERQAKAKAEEEKQAAQRAENCKAARAQITTLESGQRIARVNAKGEREFLDDAQRAAETRRAREIAASECR